MPFDLLSRIVSPKRSPFTYGWLLLTLIVTSA
jgi:hypothetical protein